VWYDSAKGEYELWRGQIRRDTLSANTLALANATNTVRELSAIADKLPGYSVAGLHEVYGRLIHHIVLRKDSEPVVVWL